MTRRSFIKALGLAALWPTNAVMAIIGPKSGDRVRLPGATGKLCIAGEDIAPQRVMEDWMNNYVRYATGQTHPRDILGVSYTGAKRGEILIVVISGPCSVR